MNKPRVTIYHNPDCGTSRNTLAMIRQSGEEPTVIEYLKDPPSREALKELIEAKSEGEEIVVHEPEDEEVGFPAAPRRGLT